MAPGGISGIIPPGTFRQQQKYLPIMNAETIEYLIGRVAVGDQAAFGRMYERTSAKLFGVCLGILGNRGQAEDALQEGFVRIWRNAARFDHGRGSGMTWLISIVRNRALTMRHSMSRLQPVEDDALELMVESLDNTPDEPDAAEKQALYKCLDELMDKQRDVVRKAYLFGFTHSELAKATGNPIGTIKTWIRRGLAQLKLCLDDATA